MAFLVATGLNLGSADSYVSLAAADTYFEAMEDAEWSSIQSDDKKMWLLRRASTVINQRYRWTDTTVYTSPPRAVAIATFELAKHWAVSATVSETPGIKSVQVGAISVEYAVPAEATSVPDQIYSFIDMLLSGIGESRVSSAASGGWGTVAVQRA
jgi:DnaT-like ssDNA binding protein